MQAISILKDLKALQAVLATHCSCMCPYEERQERPGYVHLVPIPTVSTSKQDQGQAKVRVSRPTPTTFQSSSMDRRESRQASLCSAVSLGTSRASSNWRNSAPLLE